MSFGRFIKDKKKCGLTFAVSALVLVGLLFVFQPLLAQTGVLNTNLNAVRTAAGVGNTDLMPMIGLIIQVILGLLGVIAVILMIYAGFIWMTASGDPSKVIKAKKILIAAIIGMIIIFSSFAIVSFLLSVLTNGAANQQKCDEEGAVANCDVGVCLGQKICNNGYWGVCVQIDSNCPGDIYYSNQYSNISGFSDLNYPGVDKRFGSLSHSFIGTVQLPKSTSTVVHGYAHDKDNVIDSMSLIDEAERSFPFSVSAGLNLAVVGSSTKGYNAANAGFYNNMVISGLRAYVAYPASNIFAIWNIANSAAPALISTTSISGIKDFAINGDYAYISWRSGTGISSIYTYDISNPTNLIQKSTTIFSNGPTPNYAASLQVINNHLIAGGEYDSAGRYYLKIYSLTDPATPVLSGSSSTHAYLYSILAYGGYAYGAHFHTATSGVDVYDIRNLTANPRLATSTLSTSTAYKFQKFRADGNYLYAYTDTGDLTIMNIADPSVPPAVVHQENVGSAISAIDVAGDFLYVAINDTGTANDKILIYHIADPAKPEIVNSLPVSDPVEMRVDGSHIYVSADNGSSFKVIEASNTSLPGLINGNIYNVISLAQSPWNTSSTHYYDSKSTTTIKTRVNPGGTATFDSYNSKNPHYWNVHFWPPHCFNGVFDVGLESQTDCGDECPNCDGDNCYRPELPACSNDNCASGVCLQDGCTCASNPIIDYISPATSGPDHLTDFDHPTTTEDDIGNGATSSFITISGRHFGNAPGKVWFYVQNNGQDGNQTEAPLYLGVNCTGTWSNNQIIAEVPASVALGSYHVGVESSNTGLFSNHRVFDVNTIERPGICNMVPNHGVNPSSTKIYGIRFPLTGTQDVLWEVYNRYFIVSGAYIVSSTAVKETVTSTYATGWTFNSVSDTPPENKRGRSNVSIYNGSEHSNYFQFLISQGGLGDPCGFSSLACDEDKTTCQSSLNLACQNCQSISSTLIYPPYKANCNIGKNCTCQPALNFCQPGEASTTASHQKATCTPYPTIPDCSGFLTCNASGTAYEVCTADSGDPDCPSYLTAENASQSIYSYAFTAVKNGGNGSCGYNAWGECDVNGCDKGYICNTLGSNDEWLEFYNSSSSVISSKNYTLSIYENPYISLAGLKHYFNLLNIANTHPVDLLSGLSGDKAGVNIIANAGLRFYGNIASYLDLSTPAGEISKDEGTISMWIQPVSFPANVGHIFYTCGGDASLCSAANADGFHGEASLRISYTSDKKIVAYYGGQNAPANSTFYQVTSTEIINIGTSTNVTVAYKNGGFIKLFINGQKVAEEITSTPITMDGNFNHTFFGRAYKLSSSSPYYYYGNLRELAIFDRAVTDIEALLIDKGGYTNQNYTLLSVPDIAAKSFIAVDASSTNNHFNLPANSAIVALKSSDTTNFIDSVIYGSSTIFAPPLKSIGRKEDGLDTGSLSDWTVFDAPSKGLSNGNTYTTPANHLVINELFISTPPCTCVLRQPCKPGTIDKTFCKNLGSCDQIRTCNPNGYWGDCALATPTCVPWPVPANAVQTIFSWAFTANLKNPFDDPFVIESCNRTTDCLGQPLGSPSPWFEGYGYQENGVDVGWTSSTNPYILHEKACLDSIITARFNVSMYAPSISTDTIKIFECTDRNNVNSCTDTTTHAFSDPVLSNDNNQIANDLLTINLKSGQKLANGKWYKVVLLSSSSSNAGIKSDFYKPLKVDTDKLTGRKCYGLTGLDDKDVAYCWNFQTRKATEIIKHYDLNSRLLYDIDTYISSATNPLPNIPDNSKLDDIIGNQLTGSSTFGGSDYIVVGTAHLSYAWFNDSVGKWYSGAAETTITLSSTSIVRIRLLKGHTKTSLNISVASTTEGPLLCNIGCVECQPSPWTAWWLGYHTVHSATPVADDNVCIALDANNYQWQWGEKEYNGYPYDNSAYSPNLATPTEADIISDGNWHFPLNPSLAYASVTDPLLVSPASSSKATSTAYRETIHDIPDYVRIAATERKSQKSGYCQLYINFTNPVVIEDPTCHSGTTQSPSPYKGTEDACINAMVSARFSRNMARDTLLQNVGVNGTGTPINIKIQKCTDSEKVTSTRLDGGATGNCTDISMNWGIIFPYSYSDLTLQDQITLATDNNASGSPEGIIIRPDDSSTIAGHTLTKNTWYRVIIFGGEDGVRGAFGSGDAILPDSILMTPGMNIDFDKNNAANPDGDGSKDYMWYFRTVDNDSPCPIDTVNVSPYIYFMRYVSDNQIYTANPQAANCNILDAGAYNWIWRSLYNLTDDKTDVDDTGGSAINIAAICAFSADACTSYASTLHDAQVRVFGENEGGPLDIKARASSTRKLNANWNDSTDGDKWGYGQLQIGYGNLMVTNYSPQKTTCDNPEIGVGFSLDVITSTLKLPGANRNIALYPCNEGAVYYPLDGNTKDSSGSGYDAEGYNLQFTNGRFGQAALFDGNDDSKFIEVTTTAGNDAAKPTGDMTVSAWVRLDSLATGSQEGRVIASTYDWVSSTNCSLCDGWLLGKEYGSEGNLVFELIGSGKRIGANFNDFYNNYGKKLTQVAGVYKAAAGGKSGYIKLFINGEEVAGTSTDVSAIFYNSVTNTDLVIGKRADYFINGQYGMWDGLIDDVRIYNAALTDSQIKQLYESDADSCPLIKTALAISLSYLNAPASIYAKQFIMTTTAVSLTAGLNYRVVVKGGNSGVKAWNNKPLSGLNYKLNASSAAGEECDTSTYPWNTVFVNGQNVCSSTYNCLLDPTINLCGTQYSQCTSSNDGLLYYYKFNNDFNDGVSGYNGVNQGGVTFDANGKLGQAASFNGNANSYLSVNRPDPHLQEITITAWIKPSVSTTRYLAIYTDSDNFDTGADLIYTSPPSNNKIGFWFNVGSIRYGFWNNTGSDVSTNNWEFVAARYDRSADKIAVFINGVKAEGSGSNNSTTSVRSFNGIAIGGRAANTYSKFNGLIDDLRIYNRPLSNDEIEKIRTGSEHASAYSGCDSYCHDTGNNNVASCGNGIIEPGEECDDNNIVNGDGCSSNCLLEGSSDKWGSLCGNSIIEKGEACDDGNIVSGDGCSSNCLKESGGVVTHLAGSMPNAPVCGNDIIEPGESCDDGNAQSGDGCKGTENGQNGCVFEGSTNGATCGDGIVDTGQYDSFSWSFKAGGQTCNPIQIILNPCPNGIWRFKVGKETVSSTIVIYKSMEAGTRTDCESLAYKTAKPANFFVAAINKIKDVVLEFLGFKKASAAIQWCPISAISLDSSAFNNMKKGSYDDATQLIYTDGSNANSMEIIGYTDASDSYVINYYNGSDWNINGEYRAKVFADDAAGFDRHAEDSIKMYGQVCQIKAVNADIWPRGETKSEDAFFCSGNNCGRDTGDNNKDTHDDEYDDDMSASWTNTNSYYDLPKTADYMTGNQHLYRLWATGDFDYLLKSTIAQEVRDLDGTNVSSEDLEVNSQLTDYTGDYWITGGNTNGEARLLVTSTGETGAGEVTSTITIRTFLCKNPWPEAYYFPFRDNSAANCQNPTGCFNTNFLTYYCRDAGDVDRCDGGDNAGKVCTKPEDCPGTGGSCKLYVADDLPALPTTTPPVSSAVVVKEGNASFEACPNLPVDFVPRLGYYDDMNGQQINLWSNNNDHLISSTADTWKLVASGDEAKRGLPSNFEPIIGYYHNFDGGRITLWDASSHFYIGKNVSNEIIWYAGNDSRHGMPNNGLPANFYPTVGYFDGSTNVYLWSGKILYKGAQANNPLGGKMVSYSPVTNNLPSNFTPSAGYYMSGHHELWNSTGRLFSSTNGSSWTEVTTTGPHLQAAYYDNLINKAVLWDGQNAYHWDDSSFTPANYFNSNCDINIKEFYFGATTTAGGNIGLGIKVVSNNNHYSPLYWYKTKFAPTRQGNPKAIETNGYQGIIEGRTAYINAVNVETTTPDKRIYTDMYVMSYDQDVGDEGASIFNQMVNNWKFNQGIAQNDYSGVCSVDLTNMANTPYAGYYCADDQSCARFATSTNFFCNSDRAKVARDARRLSDTQDINVLLVNYYNLSRCSNDFLRLCTDSNQCYGGGYCGRFYPNLRSGTYMMGKSFSVWPSWLSNLGNSLGTALPEDPINEFVGCASDPAGATNSITCWNDQAKLMQCPSNAYVYQYFSQGTTSNILIKSEYDTTNGTKWLPNWGKVNFLRSNPFANYNVGTMCNP